MRNKKNLFLKSFLETLALKISVDIFLKLNFSSFSCVKLYREQEHMLLLMIHKEMKAVHPKKTLFRGSYCIIQSRMMSACLSFTLKIKIS